MSHSNGSSASSHSEHRRLGLASSTPRWFVYGAGLAIVVGLVLLSDIKLWRGGFECTGQDNVQITEAQSWWSGHLDIPERTLDTAVYHGRVYSHFPILFTLIAAALWPLFEGVPHWFILFGLVLPVPLLAFALLRRRTGSILWGALLAVGMVGGTSLWPILDRTVRGCGPYFVNHTLAVIGLLVFLIEFFGRRRVWVAGLGLLWATLARPTTAVFLIPLAWMAMSPTVQVENSGEAGATSPLDPDHPARHKMRRRVLALSLIGAVVVGVPLLVNYVKFSHPLRSGYMLIYEGRTDRFAKDAHEHGLFSPHFVLRNLYYTNLGFPEYAPSPNPAKVGRWRPNYMGTGIWWTSPLLLWWLVGFRRWLRTPAERSLTVAIGCVYLALMFFHATGADQRGYNRFSMDYVPVVLAIVAPMSIQGWRRWLSVAMIVWSVAYFRWMI